MGRKVGTIMTALKDRNAYLGREVARLLVRVQSLELENKALKEKLAQRKESE